MLRLGKCFWSAVVLSMAAGSVTFGQATAPAERPVPLDKVVSFPTISVPSKGMAPREALAGISKQTGIAIYPFARATSQFEVSPKAPVWDLWASGTFAPLDFDIQKAGFWDGVREVAVAANLGIDRGGRDVLINREMDDRSIGSEGKISVSQYALCHVIESVGKFKGGKGDVWMNVYVDPRVRFTSLPAIEIDAAVDDTGTKLKADLYPTGGSQNNCCWQIFLPMNIAAGDPKAKSIAKLSGIVPLQVVTKSETIELPLELGASKDVGPWTVKVEDFGEGGQIMGGSAIYKVFVGIEPRDKSGATLPQSLYSLVQLLDKDGHALTETHSDYNRPKATKGGGVREWIEFECRLENGDTAAPARLRFDVPLEMKAASIPFEFKDISYSNGQ